MEKLVKNMNYYCNCGEFCVNTFIPWCKVNNKDRNTAIV